MVAPSLSGPRAHAFCSRATSRPSLATHAHRVHPLENVHQHILSHPLSHDMSGVAADRDHVRAWLDGIKEGFAARFAAAFESLGVEDTSDLADLTPSDVEGLMAELEKLGAKTLQSRKIKDAIDEATKEAQSTRTRLAAASGAGKGNSGSGYIDLRRGSSSRGSIGMLGAIDPIAEQAIEMHQTSGKQFLAFLSHHKAACAMEARFIKEEVRD